VPWRHTAALVKPIERERLLALLADERSSYGVSEKANGHRCLLEYDGHRLCAYNRKGVETSAPPEGAQALCRLGHPFVIDGERLLGEQAGWFVAFDVLEWKGESLLARPYRSRMTRLVRGMHAAGLLHSEQLTPLLRQAWENSTVAGLGVLLAVSGEVRARAVLTEVEETGLEGVVLRHLSATYTDAGFKYKVLAEVDAFVIGIAPGVSTGSLKLAMVRTEDRAIIEVGHVRSGLNDQDVHVVQALLEQGQYPVFRVRYLPASTTGLSLVQPQTSMECLRDDKQPQECTTAQLGAAKAFLVALAKPVKDVKVLTLVKA
jgi:ATP-dependent DNA ligase